MSRKCHVTALVMAFDTARRAFDLQAQPGWDKASEQLREALDRAREVGDVAQLPCPLAWWVSAQAQVRCWLEAHDGMRRGLTTNVSETMRTSMKFVSGTVVEHVETRGGVR